MALTQPPPLCLLHSIFSTGERLKLKCVFFFFHLIVSDTLKRQITALQDQPATICLMQSSIL